MRPELASVIAASITSATSQEAPEDEVMREEFTFPGGEMGRGWRVQERGGGVQVCPLQGSDLMLMVCCLSSVVGGGAELASELNALLIQCITNCRCVCVWMAGGCDWMEDWIDT